MNTLGRVRTAVFSVTAAAWLWSCWAVWQSLIRQAADSPELYTRTPRFQLFNFVVQYLWFLLLLLAACLLIEWLLFRVIARVLVRSQRSAG